MAYGEPKIVVDVKDEARGEILYTDAEGKQRHYYPTLTTWLEVESLQLLTVFDEPSAEATEPSMTKRFRGVARVDARSLNVIGDPSAKASTVMISFEASDWRPPKEELSSDPSTIMAPSGVLGAASMGYSRADWEIGNSDQWWMSVYLPRISMDALVAEARGGTLIGCKLGVQLRYLYTDDHPLSPPASRGNLFLRPDRKDNTIKHPEIAPGFVSMLVLQSPDVAIRKPETDLEGMTAPVVRDEPQATPASPTAAAIEALSARVEAMRGTLKWVGGFLIVALLYAAHR